MHNYDEDLRSFFPGFEKLHEMQEKVIANVIEKGSTLCIMPTGEGKSLIYWMSALEIGGISLVISPLTSLISEQVEKLGTFGYDVLELYSGIDAKKQMDSLLSLANGERNPKFIFASPEKIATDGLFEYCLRKRKKDLKLVVIDEVHCVSQWGMSFRPFYRRIPEFMDRIFGRNEWCRILALTATLNPKELSDICGYFKINKTNIIRKELLMRGEIQLHVSKFANEEEKKEKLWDIINIHADEKILVYVYRKYYKHGVEDLCKSAAGRGYDAVCFHGDMRPDKRAEIVNDFKSGAVKLVFATNAFGMGIDIPDIRVVIHYMIPESVEQYYQEIGRAARDGQGANAYLLYSSKNIEVKRQYFIDGSFPKEEKLKEVFCKLADKTGYKTLAYFEDDEIQKCLPYFITCGAVEIAGKGFADLTFLENISDEKIADYYGSTKTKGFVRTLKKKALEPDELSNEIYKAMVSKTVKVNRPPERWLVLNIKTLELSDEALKGISDDIAEKKKYKYGLLDYLVALLDNGFNSQQLHQEIARYLGTDKHQLNRIYETADHNHVRSKSEVIICDLLYKAGIKYEYEKPLEYEPGKHIEPDFTIKINGKIYYWEHVGLLGDEGYDAAWSRKLEIYRKYYDGQLIKTYETSAISADAQAVIDNMMKFDKQEVITRHMVI